MGFVAGLLYFVGFLFYIIAAICAFGTLVGFATNDENDGSGIKLGLLALVAGIAFGVGGYFIREYADSLKRCSNFTESLANSDREKVIWRFKSLSDNDKNEYIEDVFDRFYGHGFKGEYDFISDFGEENITFVKDVKETLNKKIEEMYNDAESVNTQESWLAFSAKVAGQFFLDYANDKLKNREFAKWNTDDSAWNRVLVMDSLAMSYEYLSRFDHGVHEENARKIILDHVYDSYSNTKPPFKITSNYSGTTTMYVRNSANADLNFHYSGTFATGEIRVMGHGSNSVTVPNGYYRISVTSHQTRARADNSLETLNGGAKYFDYNVKREM